MSKCTYCNEKLEGGFLGLGGKCTNPNCIKSYDENVATTIKRSTVRTPKNFHSLENQKKAKQILENKKINKRTFDLTTEYGQQNFERDCKIPGRFVDSDSIKGDGKVTTYAKEETSSEIFAISGCWEPPSIVNDVDIPTQAAVQELCDRVEELESELEMSRRIQEKMHQKIEYVTKDIKEESPGRIFTY